MTISKSPLKAFILILLFFASLLFSTQALAQSAPTSFQIINREARTNVSFDQPMVRYAPGYGSDYAQNTVFRLEFAVNNDGTRSQIPETSRFELSTSSKSFLPLVRNVRDGVLREPYDEVIPVRLVDGFQVESTTNGIKSYNDTKDTDLLQLCTDDNDSGETCNDVANINKNSYYQTYTTPHRSDDGASFSGITAVNGGSATTEQQECYDAYVEFGLTVISGETTCPVVRYQSERATCVKCILNSYALNRGADNIFSKVAATRNNIGRIDLIIREPIVFTAADQTAFEAGNPGENILDNVGFLITERGGNDPISAAAILGIEDMDDVAAGTADLTGYGLSSQQQTDLPKLARLIRTYDYPDLERKELTPGGDVVGLIAPGRSAQSIVTQLADLTEAATGTWGSTGETFQTTVFMNSNLKQSVAGNFLENRADQDLTSQTVNAKFFSLASLGITLDQEFFGVSLFANDVVSTDDLITLTDIPRQTSGASGEGGLDLMGGGGFFFRDDVPQNPTELTVGPCWRTLSSPIEGQTYQQFFSTFNTDTDPTAAESFQNFGGLWTQGSGITGARASFGDPNVFTMNGAGTTWEAIPDLTAEIPAGTGILVSVFQDDDFDGPSTGGFPKRAPLIGPARSEFTLTFGPGTPSTSTANDGFSLLGNPFRGGLDFDLLNRTDVLQTVWVYDRNGGGTTANGSQGNWISWNGSGGDITDGIIATGQGFVVQNDASATAPSVQFLESAIVPENSFYGKRNSRPDHVRLEVVGEDVYNSAWIQFTHDATLDVNPHDAAQFMPFESEFAVLSTMKGGEMLDISRFPYVSSDVQIPVTVETTTTSSLTLRLTDIQYSHAEPLYLVDTVTGESIEIREGMEYKFTPSGTPAKSLNSCSTAPQKAKTTGNVRFLITSNVPQNEPDLPTEFSLDQNYPNPFNPTTQITYQLPRQSDVRLQVFDMAGREVATLVNQSVSAGTHTVNFNASNLSSGVYMYRLQAGATVLTRKLTLIK